MSIDCNLILANPLQSLQSLLDVVAPIETDDSDDEEAGNDARFILDSRIYSLLVELLINLEEAVRTILEFFKEIKTLNANFNRNDPAPPPTPTNNNFSQLLVNNLTKSTEYDRSNSPVNMYSSNMAYSTSPNSNTPIPDPRNTSPQRNAVQQNGTDPQKPIMLTLSQTKKLNSLVRGKFCSALVGVLANGLKKQLHMLSVKEPHVSY